MILSLAMSADSGPAMTRSAAIYWNPETPGGPFYAVFYGGPDGVEGASYDELPDAEVFAWCGVLPDGDA